MVKPYLKLVKGTVFLGILIAVLLTVFDQGADYNLASQMFYIKIFLCLTISLAVYVSPFIRPV